MSTQQKKQERKRYPSDMSQHGWKKFKQAMLVVKSASKSGGRPVVAVKEVINAILYVVKTGCSWRSLPHDFPCWQTVYGYFNRWSQDGSWEDIIVSWLKRYGLKPVVKPMLRRAALTHRASEPRLVVAGTGTTIWESR